MAIRGKCHCGATEFEISEAPESVTRCNCTFCSKRGVLWAYMKPEQFRLLSSRNSVSYSSTPELFSHFHCGTCGCGTHSDTPVWETMDTQPGLRKVSVNANLLEAFDLDAVPVVVVDGRNSW
ncbi:GFA family protein [Pyxidicoccus sp. 3LFB2]